MEQYPGLGVGISTEIFTLDKALSETDITDVKDIAKSQLTLLSQFYNLALKQSSSSFRWALIAAGVGLIFFFVAIAFFALTGNQNLSTISLISGALIEFIAAVNFYLYGKTTTQLAAAEARLDRTQRFLLANNICETIEGDYKQKTRSILVIAFLGNFDHTEEEERRVLPENTGDESS